MEQKEQKDSSVTKIAHNEEEVTAAKEQLITKIESCIEDFRKSKTKDIGMFFLMQGDDKDHMTSGYCGSNHLLTRMLYEFMHEEEFYKPIIQAYVLFRMDELHAFLKDDNCPLMKKIRLVYEIQNLIDKMEVLEMTDKKGADELRDTANHMIVDLVKGITHPTIIIPKPSNIKS
jgi:hypothetical protein